MITDFKNLTEPTKQTTRTKWVYQDCKIKDEYTKISTFVHTNLNNWQQKI